MNSNDSKTSQRTARCEKKSLLRVQPRSQLGRKIHQAQAIVHNVVMATELCWGGYQMGSQKRMKTVC